MKHPIDIAISPLLKQDLKSPRRPLSARFPSTKTLHVLLSKALKAQQGLHYPYHNCKHIRGVVQRAKLFSREAKLNPEERSIILIAAAYHDYGHCGARFRQLCRAKRNDLSNEEFAALCADKKIRNYFPPEVRIEIQNAILATSFGQNDRKILARKDLYRAYQARSRLEKLLQFADVAEFLNSPTSVIRGTWQVYQESGLAQNLSNMRELKPEMLSFMGRLEVIMKKTLPFFSKSFARAVRLKFKLAKQRITKL